MTLSCFQPKATPLRPFRRLSTSRYTMPMFIPIRARANTALQLRKTSNPWRTALAVALGLLACAGASAQRAATVQVDEVVREPLTQTVPILGRLVTNDQGVVAATVAGPVTTVHVRVGDRIEAGALIAELNADRREAMVARSQSDLSMNKARLAAAAAQLRISRGEMNRLEKLKGSAAFPRARYEDQQHDVVRFTSAQAEAAAALSRTEAELSMARIELARTQVRAPYNAVITRRHVSSGAYVRLGDAVVSLLNVDALEIEADVPSNRLSGLTNGAVVKAQLDGGTLIEATVRAVIPDEDPLTRTRKVRLQADFTSQLAGAVNQSITVLVPVGEPRDVLSVHKDALIARRGGQMVFVIQDGKASPRTVQLGEAVGARFEVLSGLKPGDMAVVRGNERLRPGQALKTGKKSLKP